MQDNLDNPKNEEVDPSTTPTPEVITVTEPTEPTDSVLDAIEENKEPTTEPTEAPAAVPGVTPAATTTPTTGTGLSDISTPNKTGKGFSKLVLGLIIAGVVALLGGGTALAYFGWYQNPEKVVFDSFTNALSAKSASFAGSIKMDMGDEGSYDISYGGKASETLEGELNVKANIESGETDFDLDAGVITDKDGNVYLKVNEISELFEQLAGKESATMLETYYSDVIDLVDGNWIKVSSDDLKDVSEDYGDQQACFTDVAKKLSEDKSVVKEIEDLFKKNKFITVEKKLGSKDVAGTASLGYQLKGDNEKAASFFKGLADTTFGKELKGCDDSYDFSKVKASDFESDSDVNTTIEVWVSRFGHQLTEVKIVGKDDDLDGTIIFQPVFGEDVKVEIPSDTTSVKEIFDSYTAATEKLTQEYMSAYDDSMYNYSYDDYDYTTTY